MTNWAISLGMNQPNDQFDLGAPGHPCPICQSEEPHRHAYRPGDKLQIDVENLKPLNMRDPIAPAWSHFHADGNRVIDWWFDEKGKHPVDSEHPGKYVCGSGAPGISIIEPQMIFSAVGGKRVTRRERKLCPMHRPGKPISSSLPDDYFKIRSANVCSFIKGAKIHEELEKWGNPFDYNASVPVNKLDADLKGWVRSQRNDWTHDKKMGKERGQYPVGRRLPGHDDSWSVYDRADDDQDNGAAGPISAHQAYKPYGGDPEHPEDLTTGFAPVIAMPSSPEFNQDLALDPRNKDNVKLSIEAIQRSLTLFQPYGILLDKIVNVPADAYDRMQQVQLVIPNYAPFGSNKIKFEPGATWKYPMVYPVYGYGRFARRRDPHNIRDPHVTTAGERLTWSQVEELCKRDGLIWKEKWTEPYCVTCGHYLIQLYEPYCATCSLSLNRLDDPEHRGHNVYTKKLDDPTHNRHNVYAKPQSHSYGHSILYPDQAFKYETIINVTHIGGEEKWRKMIEHERESMAENAEAATIINEYGLPPNSKYAANPQLLQAVLLKRISENDAAKIYGVSLGALRMELSRIRNVKIEDSDELWEQLLEGPPRKEPGIYAIANLDYKGPCAYKIADLEADASAIWSGFNKVITDLLLKRISKKRIPPINGNGDLYRKRAIERGYDPLNGRQLAVRALYWHLAELLTARMWRSWPDLAPADSAWWEECSGAWQYFIESGIPE